MIKELLSYECRKVYMFFFPALLIFTGYVLSSSVPLGWKDVYASLIGYVSGAGIGWCIFKEIGATRLFLLCKPLDRRFLFIFEWGFGVLTILLIALAALLFIGFGIRMVLHPDIPFYPYIKWYEIWILAPYLLSALYAYQIVQVVIHFLNLYFEKSSDWFHGIWISVVVTVVLYYSNIFLRFTVFRPMTITWPEWLVFYFVCVMGLTMTTSYIVYCKTELE